MKSKKFTILVVLLLLVLHFGYASPAFNWVGTSSCKDMNSLNLRTKTMRSGQDQTTCGTTAVIPEVMPSQGPGVWTTTSGALISNPTAPGIQVSNLKSGLNVFTWTPINGNPVLVNLTNFQQAPFYAPPRSICTNSDSLKAAPPTNGTGIWSVFSGSGTIAVPSLPATKVTNLAAGVNVFHWTVTLNGCTSFAEISITNNTPSVAEAGPSVEVCCGSAQLSAAPVGVGCVGRWSSQGSAVFSNPSINNPIVSNLSVGNNVLQWTVAKAGCTSTANLLVVSTGNVTQTVCGISARLAPFTQSQGAGLWSTTNANALIITPTNQETYVTKLNPGVTIFKWTPQQGSPLNVIVINYQIPQPLDSIKYICSVSDTLKSVRPEKATGVWNIVKGSGVVLQKDSAFTLVNNLGSGSNVFTWTLSNNGCVSKINKTLVNNTPSKAMVGDSIRVCCGSATLNAVLPTIGIGNWTLLNGQGIVVSPTLNSTPVYGLAAGVNQFRWTVSLGNCFSSTNQIVVNLANETLTACGTSVTIPEVDPKHTQGLWSSRGVAVVASPSSASTVVTNLVAGINQFDWKPASGASILVSVVNYQMPFFNDIPKQVCIPDDTLKAARPENAIGYWSLSSGSGDIVNISNSVTPVRNLSRGTNSFVWQVSNNGCVSKEVHTLLNYQLSKVFAGDSMTVCCGTAVLNALPPNGGDGYWTTNGQAVIAIPQTFNSSVSNLAIGPNVFIWTVRKGICFGESRVVVTNKSDGVSADFDVAIQDLKVSFKNLSQGNPDKFKWDFGTGAIDSTMNPVYSFPVPGIYSVTLSIKNSKTGAIDNFTKKVVIGTGSILSNFDFLPTDSVNQYAFKNTSIGKLKFVYWDFGDGSFSVNPSPVHNYLKAGIYQACLYVSDSISKSGSCKSIAVGKQQNIANFSYYIGEKNLVNFKDISEGVSNSWFWSFGDGQFSNEQNPSHQYAKSGAYKVCMAILDSITKFKSNQCQDLSIKAATDSAVLIAKFSFFKKSASDSIYFNNDSQGPYTISYWTFGDGTSSTQVSPIHRYNAPGVYTVCLHVYNKEKGLYNEYCMDVEQIGQQDYLFADYTFFVDNNSMTVGFSDASKGKPSKWYWEFGDGKFDTVPNPKHLYAKTGIYNVCLQVMDVKNNLLKSNCQKIAIIGKDSVSQANFSYIFSTGNNKEVNFINQSIGSLKRYYWSFGDGAMDTVFAPKHVYAKAGVYGVCLKAVTSAGAVVDFCTKVSILDPDLPTSSITPDFDYILDPNLGLVTFKDNTLGDVKRWRWNFGDGSSDTLQMPKHIYKQSGIYKVCLVSASGTTNAVVEKCKTIEIKKGDDKIVINPMFNYLINPKDSTVTFNDQSNGQVNRWYWEFGNGMKAYTPKATVKFVKSGIYHVCLHLQDSISKLVAEHCEDVQVGLKAAEPLLQADFNCFVETAKPIVTFFNTTKGGGSKWYWTYGDGTAQEGETTTHVYKTAGKYEVCLNVLDVQANKYNKICRPIEVGNVACSVTADFSFYIDNKTQRASFKNMSTGNISKFSWDFGANATSTKENPEYVFGKAGKYKVSLSVSDGSKTCINSKTALIDVGNPPCGADFDFSVDLANKTINLKQKAIGQLNNYFWDFGDGTFGEGETVSHVFKANGLFRLGLKVKGANCYDAIVKDIQMGNVNCSANFNFFVDSTSNTAQFKPIEIGNNGSYYWDFGDGANAAASATSHVYKAAGFYNVRLITKSADGVCMDKKDATLLIGNRKRDIKADFDYSIDKNGKTILFINQSIGDSLRYFWNFNDQTSSADKDPIPHVYAKNGFYQVCLSVSTPSGKRNTACKDVRVARTDSVMVKADFNFDVDLASLTANFNNASVGDPDQFQWDFGDGTVPSSDKNPSHTYAASKLYLVSLKASNSVTKSSNTVYQIVNLTSSDDFAAMFKQSVQSATHKNTGFAVDFTGAVHGKTGVVVWDFGDGTKDSTTLAPTHIYSQPGSYTVSFTIIDPVTGQHSLPSSQTVNITSVGEVQHLDVVTRLYPNPSNGKFMLEVIGDKTKNYLIQISNLQSQVIVEETISGVNSFSKEFDQVISPGIYLIRIQSENRSKVLKLIVE